jgi:predicted phosphodiesterase
VSFEVVDGLAAVRQATAGSLVLWPSAPAVEISADAAAGATSAWTIELRNVIPGARLEAFSSTGVPIAVTVLDAGLPTHLRAELALPPASRSVMRLVPPAPADAALLRFAVLGDIQGGVDRVGEVLERISAEPGVEIVIAMGDLTQRGKADEMDRIERELRAMPLPFFSAIGNHDAPKDTPWHDVFGRASQRFVHRGVQFTMVDSAGATVATMVYDWLAGWLDEGRARTHLVTMHVPPIEPVGVRNGSFASRNEAAEMLAELGSGNVDLTLYGHVHSYYSFQNAGIPAVISGGGGAGDELGGTGRHYLVVDVSAEQGLIGVRMVPVD